MLTPVVNSKLVAKILIGQTESEEIKLGGKVLIGISIPVAFDTADLTVKNAVQDSENYQTVKNTDGSSFTMNATADGFINIPVGELVSLDNIKIVSSVAQTAERELTLIARPIL